MKNTVPFTSTLPQSLLGQLSTYARKLQKNKNEIIEAALRNYFYELKKLEYSSSFKRAAEDKEMIDLAELGIDDFLNITNK